MKKRISFWLVILASIFLMTLNSWADTGIWYWNPATSTWTKTWSDVPSGPIAVGDVTGDGKADIVSCWTRDLWYQDGATLGWTKVYSVAPTQIAVGDITGDGRAEIIGVWSTGIWYWNPATSGWTQVYSIAPIRLAVGDIDGNGRAEIVGTWETQKYTLTTSVSPPEGGTITPSSGTYDSGTVVTLTATANPPYTFMFWAGDISGSDNPTTVTMNGNKNVIANFSFKYIPCIPITWNTQWPIYALVGTEICYVGTVPEKKTYMSWELYGITPELFCSVTWTYPDGAIVTGEIRGDIVNTGIRVWDPLPGEYILKILCMQEGVIISRAILNPM